MWKKWNFSINIDFFPLISAYKTYGGSHCSLVGWATENYKNVNPLNTNTLPGKSRISED